MRSMVGVGITPPNVLGAPKPWSSVIISSTFGAPFGGTTRGGHHGVDCEALSLITPPNFGSGVGSCFPVIVVVASGEPGVPVICWVNVGSADRTPRARTEALTIHRFARMMTSNRRSHAVVVAKAFCQRGEYEFFYFRHAGLLCINGKRLIRIGP